MTELFLSSGEPVRFKTAPAGKLRGTRLPGSELLVAERDAFTISVQDFILSQFSLSYRSLECNRELLINTREKADGIRLETVLAGELPIKDLDGNNFRLLPGQYHITTTAVFQSHYEKDQSCQYFSVYYGSELLAGMGLMDKILPVSPRMVGAGMKDLIFELLENPYDQALRPFYYENCLRELLFQHLSAPPYKLPGELTATDMAAIYQADRIIAENLNAHFTIRTLARKAGTNAFTLKKGFQELFGIGVFGRLLQRRMERAKVLLEKTDKPIKDVCELAGYETVAGFITAFRKRFGVTPKDWRRQNRLPEN